MLYYKIIPRKQPGKDQVKYYSRPFKHDPLTLDQIADAMADGSTMTSADFRAVLDRFEKKLAEKLAEGHSVRLGLLGSFHLTFCGEGADSKADYNIHKALKAIRCQFRASTALRNALKPGVGRVKLCNIDDVEQTGS